jgi:hypothetical protein
MLWEQLVIIDSPWRVLVKKGRKWEVSGKVEHGSFEAFGPNVVHSRGGDRSYCSLLRRLKALG